MSFKTDILTHLFDDNDLLSMSLAALLDQTFPVLQYPNHEHDESSANQHIAFEMDKLVHVNKSWTNLFHWALLTFNVREMRCHDFLIPHQYHLESWTFPFRLINHRLINMSLSKWIGHYYKTISYSKFRLDIIITIYTIMIILWAINNHNKYFFPFLFCSFFVNDLTRSLIQY